MKSINELLNINDSYKAPKKLMEILYSKKEREKLFIEFLNEYDNDVTYDWFREYFENEHADRKKKKQDFTPKSVSQLLSQLTNNDNGIVYDACSGTDGIIIQKWWDSCIGQSPLTYNPRNHLYYCEELSDRTIPFLLFN